MLWDRAQRSDEPGATGGRVIQENLYFAASSATLIERRAMATADVGCIDVEQPCRRNAQRLRYRREYDTSGSRSGGDV